LQKAELIPLTPNNIYYLNECSNHYLIDQHVPRIKAYKNVGVHTITIPNKRHKSGLEFGKEVFDERNIRGFLTGKILSSMDQKIDDGKPGTGLMKADYAFDNNNQYSYAECVNQFPNPTEYVVRSDQAVCSPYFLLYDILH